jgi:hypothetical protein
VEFPRVDNALAVCRAHLDATNTRNTEIETYLVSSILAVIYADYEHAVKGIVATRGCPDSADAELGNFARRAAEKLIRSIRLGELAGAAGMFSPQRKTTFQDLVTDTPAHVAFDSIINNRHGISHELGTNMTLHDLEVAYNASKAVLEALQQALSL